MKTINVEITEEAIREELAKSVLSYEVVDEVRKMLRSRELEPLVKNVIRTKIEEAIADMDIEFVKRKAVDMMDAQLRVIARKMLEGIKVSK